MLDFVTHTRLLFYDFATNKSGDMIKFVVLYTISDHKNKLL